MGACHRRPLSLLSVRRGWAIGSLVIVDEAVEVRGTPTDLEPPASYTSVESNLLPV